MLLTDIAPHYAVGTATFNTTNAVVGSGTLWLDNVQPGDIIRNRLGQTAEVLTVNSNTSITLAAPFAGTAQTLLAYSIYRVPDSARLEVFSQRLVNLLMSSMLPSLAEVDGTGGGKVIVANGPNAAGVLTYAQLATALAVLLPANNLNELTNKRQALDNLELLGTTIASAASMDLSNTTGRVLDVSGTATITSITIPSGSMRVLRFTGAAKITTGTNLVLNNGAEATHTFAAGDLLILWSWGTTVRGQIIPIDGKPTGSLTANRLLGAIVAGQAQELTQAQVRTFLGMSTFFNTLLAAANGQALKTLIGAPLALQATGSQDVDLGTTYATYGTISFVATGASIIAHAHCRFNQTGGSSTTASAKIQIFDTVSGTVVKDGGDVVVSTNANIPSYDKMQASPSTSYNSLIIGRTYEVRFVARKFEAAGPFLIAGVNINAMVA